MPFVRFSRDKRGYEHTYLVHESGGRGKPSRARVLYWFRTPPGIKVGRQPFDEEAQRKIEAQNPGLSFDWKAIVATPMPPVPEVEHWRERRKAERAARMARREEELDSDTVNGGAATAGEAVLITAAAEPVEAGEPVAANGASDVQPIPGAENDARKRRRRRGGRRRRAQGNVSAGSDVEAGEADAESGDAAATPDATDAGVPVDAEAEASPHDPADPRPDTSQH